MERQAALCELQEAHCAAHEEAQYVLSAAEGGLVYAAAGFRVGHLRVAQHVLDAAGLPICSVAALSVEELEVSLPTWSRPLAIKGSGLMMELLQRQLPQVGGCLVLH